MSERLERPKEIAVLLNCGVSTVYRLAATGVLPAVKVPGTNLVRFRREVIEQLVRQWELNGNGRVRGRRSRRFYAERQTQIA